MRQRDSSSRGRRSAGESLDLPENCNAGNDNAVCNSHDQSAGVLTRASTADTASFAAIWRTATDSHVQRPTVGFIVISYRPHE